MWTPDTPCSETEVHAEFRRSLPTIQLRDKGERIKERVVALDVEPVDAPFQAKAGDHCAIVTQVDG